MSTPPVLMTCANLTTIAKARSTNFTPMEQSVHEEKSRWPVNDDGAFRASNAGQNPMDMTGATLGPKGAGLQFPSCGVSPSTCIS
jgi:hypothetical protein